MFSDNFIVTIIIYLKYPVLLNPLCRPTKRRCGRATLP